MSEKNLLVLIIDMNKIGWSIYESKKHSSFNLNQFVDACVGFLNAYVAMSQANAVALIASHDTHADYLYPSRTIVKDKKVSPWTKCDQIGDIDEQIRENLAQIKQKKFENNNKIEFSSMLTSAFSMALCYINRIQQSFGSTETLNYRIAVVQLTEDGSHQYMNFMNMIFTAEKLNVPIDACVIERDSSLLQQASSLTNGIYFKIPQISSLLHYLLWLYLPNENLRKMLVLPPKTQVDFRAACFCHRQLVDIGYVCSVCLSVFCSFTPICSTCESNFQVDINILKMGKKLNFRSNKAPQTIAFDTHTTQQRNTTDCVMIDAGDSQLSEESSHAGIHSMNNLLGIDDVKDDFEMNN